MRFVLLIPLIVLLSACHNPVCTGLDNALMHIAKSCDGTAPSAADLQRCDKNISRCNKSDQDNLTKFSKCMQGVSCGVDGGQGTGDPFGCYLSATVSETCLDAIEPASDAGTSGPDTSITADCVEHWWLDSSAPCDCAGIDHSQPECAQTDCQSFSVEGFNPGTGVWWSGILSASAHAGRMSSFAYFDKGTYTYAAGVLTLDNGNPFMEDVGKCTDTEMTRDYVLMKRATPGLGTSLDHILSGLSPNAGEQGHDFKNAPYTP